MPRLVPEIPLPGASELSVSKSQTTIGRSRQNDLCLDDQSVSRHHATLLLTDAGYVLKDNDSTHGTMVNGQRIASRTLEENDLIDVGIYRFRFVDARVPDVRTVHLQLLLEVTQLINSSLALEEVLEHVMDAVIRVTGAERGFLMTIDDENELQFRVGRNMDRTAVETKGVAVSFSILDKVRQAGVPVVMSDTLETDTVERPRSVVALGLRSVMCVPLKTQENLTGLIYVDSQRQVKRFSDDDLDLFCSLASQAAVAIEKSRLHEQLRSYSLSLEEKVRQRTRELVQAQTEAAIGRLAAGMAHEINSPLGVIMSNVDMLGHFVRRLEEGNVEGSPEILEGIAGSSAAASARLRRIVKAFESFAGLDQAEMKAIRIGDVIETVLALLDHELGNRISVKKELSETPLLKCVPGRIHQAFMNVLLNAIEAIDGSGEISVRSERSKGKTVVTIQDSGRGMTPDQLENVFEPGFTRKGNRVGSGMGLMLTRQIVHEHNGEIQIESAPGKGTAVKLLFGERA